MTSGRNLIDIAKKKQASHYDEAIDYFIAYLSNTNIDSEIRAVSLQEVLQSFTPSNVAMDFVCILLKKLLSMDLYERNQMALMTVKDVQVLECTGSGKKPIKTLNVSTPSILLAVAAGAHIIKKGSHATSSLLGSADVLSMVGFKSSETAEEQQKQLLTTGFTFVNIEHIIPKFNSIYSGFYYKPHILSFALGACVTSIRGNKLLYGISRPECDYSAKLLSMLVSDSFCTYCSTENGIDYFDEFIGSKQQVCYYRKNGIYKEEYAYQLPLTKDIFQPISVESAVHEFLCVLRGTQKSNYERVVIHNSAFFLLEAGVVDNWQEGLALSKETLLSGKAFLKLQEVVETSGGDFNAKL